MGMAASQARLLTITARIHDVEYQAQSIQNAKVQLATQSDQVYSDYMEALDAQSLTFKIINDEGGKSSVAANFNNLFSINAATPAINGSYALRNERGLLVVDNDIYDAYQQFRDGDAYAFAVYMLSGKEVSENELGQVENGEFAKSIQAAESSAFNRNKEKIGSDSELANLHKALEEYVGEGNDIYDASKVSDENKEKYESTLKEYRHKLYTQYGEDICTQEFNSLADGNVTSLMSAEQFDFDMLNKYVDKFNQIKMCGGCVPISDYNGNFGDASNNNEWLTSMVQCGKFTVDVFKKDKNGNYTNSTTSPSSDSNLSYTTTSSIDNTAAKKAEAKYEKDLKDINQKDKKFDLTLSKLETERTALTTEYDSVKKVIEDNIDRTFGIFS